MKKNHGIYVAALGALLMGLTSCGNGGSSSSLTPSIAPSSEPSITPSSESIGNTKELTLNYIDGSPVKNAKIFIVDGDTDVATGKTDAEGKFSFQGEDKTYAVEIESLPKGYYVEEGLTFPAGQSEYTITASSQVINADLPAITRYSTGDIIYDFEFETTQGDSLFLSDVLQEKDLVVINFWATWCSPCMSEFPSFNNALHGKDGDEDFLDSVGVITVNTDITLAQLKSYEKTKDFFTDFMMTVSDGSLTRAFSISGIPTTVFVNKYGRIQYIHVGADTNYYSWRKYFRYLTGDEAFLGTVNPYSGPVTEEMPDSGDMEALACAEGFLGTFEMPSQALCYNLFGDASYASTLWPLVLDEQNECIKTSNSGKEGTYCAAVLKAPLNAGETLKMDLKLSLEKACDLIEFYSVSNNRVTGYLAGFSGVSDDWFEADIMTAETTGTQEIFIFASKDDCIDEGFDAALIKNIRAVAEE